jgi:pimeloyl-ACP methyl ester carboxylesterase
MQVPPALFVWGEDDELIGVADGREAAGRVPAAEFVALAACGHSPMEECPQAFVAAVEPFLDGLAER